MAARLQGRQALGRRTYPFTTRANDATVIDPPAPRRWWLVWLAVGLAGGLALGGFAWRRRRAAVTH
jgi:hypothetical protein